VLAIRNVPPDCSTKPWNIDRPRPVPAPAPFVVKNGSVACARVASSMPVPMSVTVILTQGSVEALFPSRPRCGVSRSTSCPDWPLSELREGRGAGSLPVVTGRREFRAAGAFRHRQIATVAKTVTAARRPHTGHAVKAPFKLRRIVAEAAAVAAACRQGGRAQWASRTQ
jgi:hypothetical protein